MPLLISQLSSAIFLHFTVKGKQMILIKNTVLNGSTTDILIEKNKITEIREKINSRASEAAEIIDGSGTAVIPSLINGHTHTPMVLMRGYGDDMLLDKWLSERIWPLESRLGADDFYCGYRLGILEMIKNGTGFFNEMYMHPEKALEVLAEFPMKALLNYPIVDGNNEEEGRRQADECRRFFNEYSRQPGVKFGVAAHSPGANSKYSLEWIRDFASDNDLDVNIHLSETEYDVKNSKAMHNGMSPVEYLDSIGFLNERVLAAHTVWLSEKDMEILAERGVRVIYNPVSNMKLATGKVFPYRELKKRGVSVLLGTDGAASNNNLDLFEEMKTAALLQKHASGDPTLMSASDIFRITTSGAAEIFSTGGGEIREGAEADLLLVDVGLPEMVPLTDLISNLVYSANGSCVRTNICGGKILMHDRFVEKEDEIKQMAAECTARLLSRR